MGTVLNDNVLVVMVLWWAVEFRDVLWWCGFVALGAVQVLVSNVWVQFGFVTSRLGLVKEGRSGFGVVMIRIIVKGIGLVQNCYGMIGLVR